MEGSALVCGSLEFSLIQPIMNSDNFLYEDIYNEQNPYNQPFDITRKKEN